MNPITQVPVLLFLGMMASFALVPIPVLIGDALRRYAQPMLRSARAGRCQFLPLHQQAEAVLRQQAKLFK